jgi:hypothetical protein
MQLTENQYAVLFQRMLAHISYLQNLTFLKYPGEFVLLGEIPVYNYPLGDAPYESDYDVISSGDYEFDSCEAVPFKNLSATDSSLLLTMYRRLVGHFHIDLTSAFHYFFPYFSNTSSPLENLVAPDKLTEIRKVLGDDKAKLYLHPSIPAYMIDNATKAKDAYAKEFVYNIRSAVEPEGLPRYLAGTSVYSILNSSNELPLDPGIGFEHLNELRHSDEEFDCGLLDIMDWASSLEEMTRCLFMSSGELLTFIIDVLAAHGLVYTTNQFIVWREELMHAHDVIKSDIDFTVLMDDMLDHPDQWNQARRGHLTRALNTWKLLKQFKNFTEKATVALNDMEKRMQAQQIKILEAEANELVIPQIIEHRNQYSW